MFESCTSPFHRRSPSPLRFLWLWCCGKAWACYGRPVNINPGMWRQASQMQRATPPPPNKMPHGLCQLGKSLSVTTRGWAIRAISF
ncbi:hypothetical protein BDV95DRAFT_209118 [Massariosphaeria phaeospora]|uniref:Secreted protein n=1 Tax=Massariosphaeria phaeospora TaxID=100035 RepID=A0A7C8M377_9PLEO|nr:hypothetical protein BDV95DRAFT_209118 [Massariosphaeria phaeospora]